MELTFMDPGRLRQTVKISQYIWDKCESELGCDSEGIYLFGALLQTTVLFCLLPDKKYSENDPAY